jgi:hypothetical protein
MSCCAVTLVAAKPPARPPIEEFLSPLLFGFTETTSKATSTDVGIGALWAATIAPNAATRPQAICADFMFDSLDGPAAV